MTPEDVAHRFAYDRQGFELVSFAAVGLPYWRMRVRCEVLARKSIATIDEMVLRAISAGVCQPDDLMVFLGLDPQVLEGSVVGMLASEWLRPAEDGSFVVTELGSEIEQDASQMRSEDRSIMFDYDGLLRRPTLVDRPLEPRELAKLGAREIPAQPARRPDEFELRDRASEIERFVRRLGDGRDQDVDLLAVKEVKRGARMFREALALVYRAEAGREVQVALVIDEELSSDHEAAFAKAGLAKKLGIDRIGRRTSGGARGMQITVESSIAELADPVREAEIRALMRTAADRLEQDEGSEEGRAELKRARRELRTLPVRSLEAYEHLPLLQLALRGARERLLIISPRLRAACVDDNFVGALQRLLESGVDVRIGCGPDRGKPNGGDDEAAFHRLHALGSRYQQLRVARLSRATFGMLISDKAYMAVTGFNWLAWRGDADRLCRDERGTLVAVTSAIDTAWKRSDDDFPQMDHGRSVVAGRTS
jgi:hypothetical protein